LGVFFVESLWLALSAGFPGIFDENTHLAIIRVYARQWSPFFSSQPIGADGLGALARDPSYLFHYLMSFPDRILVGLTHSQFIEIVGLRIVGILLFAVALVLFRKLLLATKASPAIVHVTLLFFVLTPLVPFLAAQINYDNLLLPLAALGLLLTLQVRERFVTTKQIDSRRLLIALAVGLLASLAQFEFLPILVAMITYFSFLLWKFYRLNRSPAQFGNGLLDSWRSTKRIYTIASVGLIVLASGLFVHAYGVNVIKYHNPIPPCGNVLSIERCKANGTWLRSYIAENTNNTTPDPARYVAGWGYRMFKYAFYSNSGGSHADAMYVNVAPLPGITIAALVVFIVGSLAVIRYHRQLLRRYPALGLLVGIAVFYVAVLFLRNYLDYLQTGQKFGINSRYLFPVILPVALLLGLGWQRLLAAKPIPKIVLLAVVLLLFLQGGGALTFIYYNQPGWRWADNTFSTNLNTLAQKAVSRFIIP